MPELDDHDLLAEFARTESEAAFAALAARYVNLVYSTALRFAGNPHHAEEITQAVFIILARKAGKLSPRAALSGWLYQTARLTAANFMKGEIRRQHREQEAYMQSTMNAPDPAAWQQLAPHLDEAMGRLGETDRDAIVLRFFENKTAREVGAALQLTEAAAHKRVNRALEKLRKIFSKRGVTLSGAIIAGAVSANSVQAAPAALAKTISAVAVAKGATASISTLTLVKGALKIMAWTKAKTAVVTGVVVLFTAGTATVVVEKVAHVNSLRQRLPDGSVLELNRVSFGDKHEFIHAGKRNDRSWPGHEELAVEFGVTGRNAASNSLVKPSFFRQFRCVVRGETGIDFVEEFSPPGFKKYPDGFFNYIQTSIFPRDSKWLWFRVEKSETNNPFGPWQTVAQFKVPNPAHSANNPWVASPTPITNSVGGMDFVLDEVTVETRPYTPRDIWNHVVTVPTKVFDHGVLLTNWAAARVKLGDASGNYDPILQRHRSLDPRYVWKLDMDFERQANFTAENLATVNLPRAGSKISAEVMGQPVTVSWDGTWIDADMPTNRPDLALKFVGAADAQGNEMLNPSGSWDQYRFRKGDFIVRREGILTTVNVRPTKLTFAIVPNIHATFHVQPRLVVQQAK